jgi:hypothetical protein
VRVDDHVAQLAAVPHVAVQHRAADDDPATDADVAVQVDQVLRPHPGATQVLRERIRDAPRFPPAPAGPGSAPAGQSEQAKDGMKMARGMPLYQFAGFLSAPLPAEQLDQLIKLTRTAVGKA